MTIKRTILITGASAGIGKEVATLAASRGHTVIATAQTEALMADLPSNAHMKLVIDICDSASIDAALEQMDKAGYRLNCLINNAGYAQPGPIELVDDERVRRQFNVNVFGTLAMTRAALPYLRKHIDPSNRSLIVTLSSMLGLISSPFQGIYAASKFALEGAFDALRMEIASQNIDVALVEPGWITTNFLKTSVTHTAQEWLNNAVYGKGLKAYFSMTSQAESAKPTGAAKMAAAMAGTAQDVADTIIRAIETEKPKARYPVTASAKILPKLSRILPTSVWDKMQSGPFAQKK